MEDFTSIFLFWHLASSVGAGLVGDKRTCGFGGAFIAWLVNPLLGAAVLICAKDKIDAYHENKARAEQK